VSTLVVLCHPVPESFVAAVAAQVVETLGDAGGEPQLLDLYADGFSPTDADTVTAAINAGRALAQTSDPDREIRGW